jgi:hypothetical protein
MWWECTGIRKGGCTWRHRWRTGHGALVTHAPLPPFIARLRVSGTPGWEPEVEPSEFRRA